jgi:hypothetical protein
MALHDPITDRREAADVFGPAPLRWTQTPAAQAALAACVAANILPVLRFDTYAITRDERWVYEGPEADAVKAAMDAFFVEQVFVLPRDEALAFYAAQPDLTDAIDTAKEWALQVHRITTPVRQINPAAWA